MNHRKVMFRVRKIYFEDIIDHKKNTEYRADTDFWRVRLFGRRPPVIAVFCCGTLKVSRWIRGIETLSKEDFLKELGRKPPEQGLKDLQLYVRNTVIAVRLGDDSPEFYQGANEEKKGNVFP